MAFKQWSTGTSTDLVPWAKEYVLENQSDVGRTDDVIDVKIRPKGLILETRFYAGWVFKSKTLHAFVLEFIEQWYKSKSGSPIMQLMLTSVDPHWVIGVDDERQGGWGKGTEGTYWHQHYLSAEDNPQYRTNPLPLPTTDPTPERVLSEHQTPVPDIRDLMPVQKAPDLPPEASLNGSSPPERRNTRKPRVDPS